MAERKNDEGVGFRLHLPAHMRGPWPKGRTMKGWGLGPPPESSRSHRSGKKRSGSGKKFGLRYSTWLSRCKEVWKENTTISPSPIFYKKKFWLPTHRSVYHVTWSIFEIEEINIIPKIELQRKTNAFTHKCKNNDKYYYSINNYFSW
jgi:hypothetical protein